jgi:D-alanine-D-alanine ligase
VRVGLVYESKAWFPFNGEDPRDWNSELLAETEVEELVEGLRAAGHHVVLIGDTMKLLTKIEQWRRDCDIVLNKSVGYRGIERKSRAAAILEEAAIPYVGSTPYVLSLTRNKFHTKLVVAQAGVPTPPATLLFAGLPDTLSEIPYPAIVKPVAESSSIGIETGKAVVQSPSEARQRATELYQRYQQPVLVETFIPGVEMEVPLLIDPTPRALLAVAIGINQQLPPADFYLASDCVYDDKYDFVEPPSTINKTRVVETAVRAAQALGMRDYGRIDFRIDASGQPWFIEASTHPHIQHHSSFYLAAHRRGMSYGAMLNELLQAGARRYGLGTVKMLGYTNGHTREAADQQSVRLEPGETLAAQVS